MQEILCSCWFCYSHVSLVEPAHQAAENNPGPTHDNPDHDPLLVRQKSGCRFLRFLGRRLFVDVETEHPFRHSLLDDSIFLSTVGQSVSEKKIKKDYIFCSY